MLNQHCFTSVRHAQDLLDDWRADYNTVRPHTALGGLSPETFIAKRAHARGSLPDARTDTRTPNQPALVDT